jgi:uncharacterized protein (UPF0210 family)
MRIRSITYFCSPGYPLDEDRLRQAADFLAQAKAAYETSGYEVQTTRMATLPFPTLLGEEHIDQLPRLAERLAALLSQAGIAYASLGPALPAWPRSYELIAEAIAASENIFFGGMMADEHSGIDLAAVKACAQIIVRCAPLDINGFANLRFAALTNVPPGAPFFPAAYHAGEEPAFAIATEAADLAVSAFTGARTVEEGRRALIDALEHHGRALEQVASTRLWHVPFGGIDFSLAPSPDDSISLGAAVEQMGVPRIGLHGSLAAAAILTEAIEQADFSRTGFSGFMQPILEDSVLARRAAEGTLSVKDALLYSAVCGTGLDTVPLPGDTTTEQLTPLLLDLCALSLRLAKPLTARLLPVPGKKAGEPTSFDFAFFTNSRIMSLDSAPLQASLAADQVIPLRARRR